jgi:adenine phosphoribosyltransferase
MAAVPSTASLIPVADEGAADNARSTCAARLTRHKDFPHPPIVFVDVLPIFRHTGATRGMIAAMAAAARCAGSVDIVMGVESRGFILGALLADALALPFVPVRKAGKLPGECVRLDYALEYGHATLELQKAAVTPGARVLMCDDLLATGGTLAAACSLAAQAGCTVTAAMVIIELVALGGAGKVPAPVLTFFKEE